MDVCCLNRPFDDQTQDRIKIESEAVLAILNRCMDDWTLVGSEVIEYEISKIPDEERKRKVKILASISKEKIIVDESIVKRASEIEKKIGLKPIDALHLACAEKFVDVMLTTDDEIIKKVRANKEEFIKIKVENPVVWLMEVLANE
ncbi:MAG: PIN domain-containing protein [Candidatus Hydrothermarchaeota archaeon]|nr:MAG: PIN domain-containing protein [Candidatus Hydrothermarchaeota archaeon]